MHLSGVNRPGSGLATGEAAGISIHQQAGFPRELKNPGKNGASTGVHHLHRRQARRRFDRDGVASHEPAGHRLTRTRNKVLQAVEDLGYTPNSAARHLRTLRSGKLLVTVPDISNPFFALILQGIEDAAQREGYAVLLGDTQHEESAKSATP